MRRDYRGREHEAVAEIVELDKIDVEACDVLLVNFDKPSVGTSMEVMYAWERGKTVIVVHKAGAILSPWLVYHSQYRFTAFEDAFTFLEEPLT
jgi:nucleoside 2-deoxyribosyltransferase